MLQNNSVDMSTLLQCCFKMKNVSSLELSFIFSLSLSFVSGQLMLVGIIDVDSSHFLVELYAYEDIADLGIYTIISDGKVATFPQDKINKASFITVSEESLDKVQIFRQTKTGHVYINNNLDLSGGAGPVELKKNGQPFDKYGEEGVVTWNYRHGWAGRKGGAHPSTSFISTDWVYNRGKLSTCWSQGNSFCEVPYPFDTFPGPAAGKTLSVG